jgi:hypothetical protein
VFTTHPKTKKTAVQPFRQPRTSALNANNIKYFWNQEQSMCYQTAYFKTVLAMYPPRPLDHSSGLHNFTSMTTISRPIHVVQGTYARVRQPINHLGCIHSQVAPQGTGVVDVHNRRSFMHWLSSGSLAEKQCGKKRAIHCQKCLTRNKEGGISYIMPITCATPRPMWYSYNARYEICTYPRHIYTESGRKNHDCSRAGCI